MLIDNKTDLLRIEWVSYKSGRRRERRDHLYEQIKQIEAKIHEEEEQM